MARFCKYCGASIGEKAQFCKICGKDLRKAPEPDMNAAPPEAPPKVSVNVPPSVSAPSNAPAAEGKRKVSAGRRALLITLAAAIAAGGVALGVWLPGLLKRGGGEDLAAAGTEDDWYSGMDTVAPSLAEDIALRYSDKDIEQAEAKTASVSVDEPVVEVGDVSVDMKDWNLENEEDELTVRRLPELSDDSCEWSIRAYDFSLASGQEEFPTNVEITIPREESEDEYATCVGFNEEAGTWEELPFDISEDRKSYIIYADHFSIKGVKRLKYIYKDGKLQKNTEGEEINLDTGIFKEYGEKVQRGETRMQAYVLPDRELMWDMYALKTLDDVKNISTLVKELAEPDANDARNKAATARDSASAFIGLAGAGDSLNGLLGEIGYKSSFVGYALTAADLALVMVRVQADAYESNKSYLNALSDALYNNRLAIGDSVGSAVLTLGTGAVFGSWPGALVGLCIWGISKVADKVYEPAPWYDTKTPSWTDLYSSFYYSGGVVYGSEAAASGTYAVMKKPASMSDDKWSKLSKVIDKHPLYARYNKKKGTYKFVNFAYAYTEIISLYSDEPYAMANVIEEFYSCYARAFWELPDKRMYDFVKSKCDPDFFEEEYLAAGSILRPLDDETKQWTEDLVSFVRVETAEQLESSIETALLKTFVAVERDMDKVARLLNTKLVFHVIDNSLRDGQSFKDSIYCVDWQSIKENNDLLPQNVPEGGYGDGGYDAEDFITPMRFVCKEPIFRPLDSLRDPVPYTEYYPFTSDFTPRAKKNQKTDVVYTCTLYHYLMMGAPKQMLFKDVSDPKTYEQQEGIYADILFPQIDENTVIADVYIKVEGKNDIKELEGTWMPPSAGSEYENKGKGSATLQVSDGGSVCNFTSSFKGDEDRHFYKDSVYSDVSFVYDKSTGVLSMWDRSNDDKLNLTLERVTDTVIRIRELDIYLENKEKTTAAKTYKMRVQEDATVELWFGATTPADCTVTIYTDDTVEITLPRLSYTNNGLTYTRNEISFKGRITSRAGDRWKGDLSSVPSSVTGSYGDGISTTGYSLSNIKAGWSDKAYADLEVYYNSTAKEIASLNIHFSADVKTTYDDGSKDLSANEDLYIFLYGAY